MIFCRRVAGLLHSAQLVAGAPSRCIIFWRQFGLHVACSHIGLVQLLKTISAAK